MLSVREELKFFFKYNLKNVSLQRVNTVLDFGRVCVCVCVCVELWTA